VGETTCEASGDEELLDVYHTHDAPDAKVPVALKVVLFPEQIVVAVADGVGLPDTAFTVIRMESKGDSGHVPPVALT
jgi:hypothetical protein